MSLATILKTVGKDLKDVDGWIADGIKLAEPVVGVIDPPLIPTMTAAEAILDKLFASGTVTAAAVQSVITSAATNIAINGAQPIASAVGQAGSVAATVVWLIQNGYLK